jgi:hypothetical protein
MTIPLGASRTLDPSRANNPLRIESVNRPFKRSGRGTALPSAGCYGNKNEEENMTKFFIYAAIVIGFSATATLAVSPRTVKPGTTSEMLLAADGAFRDGLYLGKLAAEHSQPLRPAVGRWSTDQDRSMFADGYRRGYNEFLAGAQRAHSTE